MHIPPSERRYAEAAVIPDASTPLDLVLALDQAEDPEMAAFLWHRITHGIDHDIFSLSDVVAAAQNARDAGDVKPAIFIMIADDCCTRVLDHDDLDVPYDDLSSVIAKQLRGFGEPGLARLSRDDEDAYKALVARARVTTLRLEHFLEYDPDMHILPLAAAVIARAIVADPDVAAQRMTGDPAFTFGWLARRLISVGGESSGTPFSEDKRRIRRYQERALIHVLIRDAWRAVAHWEPERRAQEVLNPSSAKDWTDVWYAINLRKWLDHNPSLLEVGLVTLGASIILPPPKLPVQLLDERPELHPLLMNLRKGPLWTIRQVARDWLWDAGYVRVHDVLLAAVAEPPDFMTSNL